MKYFKFLSILYITVSSFNKATYANNRGGAYLSYPECIASNVDTLWPDFNDNTHYYVCIGLGFSKRMPCQDTLMFSFQRQVCVFGWEWESPPAPSEITPLQQTSTTTTHSSLNFSDCQSCWRPECRTYQDTKTLWPDYDNWEYYFECIGHKKMVRRPCPRKTVFSFAVQMCVWPNEWSAPAPSSTKTKISTVSTTPTPTTENTSLSSLKPTSCEVCWRPLCEPTDLHLLWPDFDNKRFYFQCLKAGEFIKRKCYKKLQFNFYTQKCEDAENWKAPPSL